MPSWTLTSGSAYDPDKFYTEASDKTGRGEPSTVRLPAQVGGSIAALVQSAKIPEYRTQSDFIRDAVVHRLQSIGEKIDSKEIVRTVHLVTLMNQEISHERDKDDYNALMNLIEQRHMDYSSQSMDKANSYIKDRLTEIDAIPDDYQEDYERRLSAKLYRI